MPGRALSIGEQVYLRKPLASDREELARLTRESARLHRGWVAAPSDARAFVRWMKRTRDGRCVHLLVCERTSRSIVGVYTFSEIVRGNFWSAYLGYYAHAAFVGRGYMTEGMRLALRHAFAEIGLHRVEANVQPTNVRSIRLV